MQEEEFDEFEEATYSQQPKQTDSSPSQPLHSSLPILTTSEPTQLHFTDAIDGGSAFFSPPLATQSLQTHSSVQQESFWPELAKASSAHSPPEPPFMVDFTKNYSLTEQIATPITQNFLELDILGTSEPQNTNLPTPLSSTIFQNQPNSSLPIVNNDFLTGFSSTANTLELIEQGSNNNKEPTSEKKVQLFQSLNQVEESINLYGSSGLTAEHDFGIFSSMEGAGKVTTQTQVKLESTNLAINNIFNLHSHELGTSTQPNSDSSSTFGLPTKQQDSILTGFQTSSIPVQPISAQLPELEIYEQPQKAEQVQESRKQSEEFQFHEATSALPVQGDVRKQSQEFVFEAPQQQPILSQQIPNEPQQLQQQTQLDSPPPLGTQIPEPSKQTQNIYQEHTVEKLQKAAQEEDDQFGDFQQTTVTPNSHTPQPEIIPSPVQDNTVRINEEYINSQEAQFYHKREKELQELVDSLPDYSFLFAQGYLT